MSGVLLQVGLVLLEIAAPLLTAGLGWLGVKAAAFVGAKTGWERLQQAILLVNDITVTVVQELQQTMVAAAKRRANGGPLTEADKTAIKTEAFNRIRAHFTPERLVELARVLGVADINAYIQSKIEAAVLVLGKGVVQAPTTPGSDSINVNFLPPFYPSDAAHPATPVGSQYATGIPGR